MMHLFSTSVLFLTLSLTLASPSHAQNQKNSTKRVSTKRTSTKRVTTKKIPAKKGQYLGSKSCGKNAFKKKSNGEDILTPGCDINLKKGFDAGIEDSGDFILQVAADVDEFVGNPELFSGQQPDFATPSAFRPGRKGAKSNAVRGSQSGTSTSQ